MNIDDYLLEQSDIPWDDVLGPWDWLLPPEFVLWLVNRFGDLFIVTDDGSVHMLDVGGGTLEPVAESREEFCELLDVEDNANDWLMIPLIDDLTSAGKTLASATCYGHILLPVLGGDYTVDNTMVVPLEEYYSYTGSAHLQIKDLPDGAAVQIDIQWPPRDQIA